MTSKPDMTDMNKEHQAFEAFWKIERKRTWMESGCHKDRGAEPSINWAEGAKHDAWRGWQARASLAASAGSEPVAPDGWLDCEFVKPRPLDYPLRDFHRAPGDGPLNATWQDKPHRIVYDLIAAVRYYATRPSPPEGAPAGATEPDKADPRKLQLQGLIFALARLSCVPPMAPALEHQLDRLTEFYFDSGDEKFARSLVQLKRSARSEGRRSVLLPSASVNADGSITQGTWAHLKLMMEASAWDGQLQLSDALANIDDFAAARPSPPEGAGWISVDERLPEPGMPVLLDIGKKYPIRAMWAPAKTLEASNDSDAVGDYDEATDTYYCPEGWYEWNQHEETHWFVTETPRAWAPLPLPAPPASEAKGA